MKNRRISIKDFISDVHKARAFFSSEKDPLSTVNFRKYFNQEVIKDDLAYFWKRNSDVVFRMIYLSDDIKDFGKISSRKIESPKTISVCDIDYDKSQLYVLDGGAQMFLRPVFLVSGEIIDYLALKNNKYQWILLPVSNPEVLNICLASKSSTKVVPEKSQLNVNKAIGLSYPQIRGKDFLESVAKKKVYHLESSKDSKYVPFRHRIKQRKGSDNKLSNILLKDSFAFYSTRAQYLQEIIIRIKSIKTKKGCLISMLNFGILERFVMFDDNSIELRPEFVVSIARGKAVCFKTKFNDSLVLPMKKNGVIPNIKKLTEEELTNRGYVPQRKINF